MEKAEEQKMVWAPQVRHNKASWVARSSCTCQKKLELCLFKNLFVITMQEESSTGETSARLRVECPHC